MSGKQNRIHKLLEQGLQQHRLGNLDAAEEAYIKASNADPRNSDALNLRGVVAMATTRPSLAVTLFRKASALQPANPGLWGNLGNALFETGDYAEALSAYSRAAQLAPGNPDFAIGIANALAATGKVDEARTLLLTVTEQHPGHAAPWFNLGKLAEKTNQLQQGIEFYQCALRADPRYGNAHLNLGVIFQVQARLDEAEQHYRAALSCGAPRETSYINLISLLTIRGNFRAAEEFAGSGITELPRSTELRRLLSSVWTQQGRLDAALGPVKKAAELDPDDPRLQMAWGGLLFETGSPEEGIAKLETLRRAHPGDTHIAYVLGIMHLTAGNFEKGWHDFIHREIRQNKVAKQPSLSAQFPPDLNGKTVRLLREQGLGDELFFLRYAPILKSLGARVTSITNPKLTSMLARTRCIDQIIEETVAGAPVFPPDVSGQTIDMVVGDVPRALQYDFREYCRELPGPLALSPIPEKVDAVRKRLAQMGPPPYLALTWRGGVALHEQSGKWWSLYKNISLDDFGKTLAGLPFTLLAVQRKPLPDEIAQLAAAAGAPVHDLCDVNDDLEAMLALLDLVDDYVGVSNTNMHLRAGLNRRARVLVPRPSEWRWMAYGNQSPWFPGFGVYRQGTDGQWREALTQLRADLLAMPTRRIDA